MIKHHPNLGMHVQVGMHPKVEQLDVSCLASVTDFAARWDASQRPLHALVNNAGVMSFGCASCGSSSQHDTDLTLYSAPDRATDHIATQTFCPRPCNHNRPARTPHLKDNCAGYDHHVSG